MATQNIALVRDNSTFANFKQWAKAISDFFTTAGWLQSGDSGQVVWTATVFTCTQVAVAGAVTTYSYSSYTGPAPRIGMSVNVTGFGTGGNNVSNAIITGGSFSGTFTVATTTQANETHSGSATTTAQSTTPTSGNYVYEIWTPQDGLTTFYFKVEYGTGSGSSNTCPQMRFSIGSGSSVATLTGYVTNAQAQPASTFNVTSTSIQYQCYFSGDSGRIAVMMWRDDTSNPGNLFFGVQRSLNSSGSPTSSYVTLLSLANGQNSSPCFQQSLQFGVGVGNAVVPNQTNQGSFLCLKNTAATSDNFNGMVSLSPVFPDLGFFDNPMDIVMLGSGGDFTEGAQYAVASGQMPYGISHNYIASKNTPLQRAANCSNGNGAFLMRYD